jgi:glycerol-3-phosphate O-acyltransferase
MVKGFDPNGERDLVFIPVGLNYDRVLEDRSLLVDKEERAQHRGKWFVARTTLSFVGRQIVLMLRGRWYRFGYACVNFGQPVSMRRYLAHRDDNPQTMLDDEYRQFIEELGAYLLERVGEVVPILPVSLVATVLLNDSRGLNEFDIKAQAHALLGDLEDRGAKLYIPRSDWEYAVMVGLRMLILRKAVHLDNGIYVVDRDDTRLLQYYANAIRHLVDDDEPARVRFDAHPDSHAVAGITHPHGLTVAESLLHEQPKAGDE